MGADAAQYQDRVVELRARRLDVVVAGAEGQAGQRPSSEAGAGGL